MIKFSKISVKRFLDVACEPSLQLREIARRGYETVGLDVVPEMLGYIERKAKEERALDQPLGRAENVNHNMVLLRRK
jgi:2-polyprenyl-3-methyl-5-hydroxy-6-metoxy-1,4-benzoquinol methylase